MSGGPKRAKRPLERRLDGRLGVAQHCNRNDRYEQCDVWIEGQAEAGCARRCAPGIATKELDTSNNKERGSGGNHRKESCRKVCSRVFCNSAWSSLALENIGDGEHSKGEGDREAIRRATPP